MVPKLKFKPNTMSIKQSIFRTMEVFEFEKLSIVDEEDSIKSETLLRKENPDTDFEVS